MKETLSEVKRERLSFEREQGVSRLNGIAHFRHTFTAYWFAADFLKCITYAFSTLCERIV